MGLGIIFSLKSSSSSNSCLHLILFFPSFLDLNLIRNKMSLPEIIQRDMEDILGIRIGGVFRYIQRSWWYIHQPLAGQE